MIQKWTRPVETLLPCEFKMNVFIFSVILKQNHWISWKKWSLLKRLCELSSTPAMPSHACLQRVGLKFSEKTKADIVSLESDKILIR